MSEEKKKEPVDSRDIWDSVYDDLGGNSSIYSGVGGAVLGALIGRKISRKLNKPLYSEKPREFVIQDHVSKVAYEGERARLRMPNLLKQQQRAHKEFIDFLQKHGPSAPNHQDYDVLRSNLDNTNAALRDAEYIINKDAKYKKELMREKNAFEAREREIIDENKKQNMKIQRVNASDAIGVGSGIGLVSGVAVGSHLNRRKK